jgi:hypothetical protein
LPKVWIGALWVALPVVFTAVKYSLGPSNYNNYLIYKHVHLHVLEKKNLYDFYPSEHLYQNHYGPSFSLVIAPFALLPDVVGMILWAVANSLALYYSILRLPLSERGRITVLVIVLLEAMGSIQNQQFNPMLTAWIVMAFVWICEGRLFRAALLISGGALVKLYGILALLFTPFDGRHLRMTLMMLSATVLLACLPMLYSDPEFILRSYHDWFLRLVGKNSENIRTNLTDGMQDLSLMGMIRRISGWASMPNLLVMLPGALLMLAPLLRRDMYSVMSFRLTYLAQVLMGIVLFSTSSESPTYVIAVTGFALWYSLEGSPSRPMVALLVLMFVLTMLPATDLFPKQIKKEWVNRYALKALPSAIAWMVVTYRLLTHRFTDNAQDHATARVAARP